jgi:hypothetical protein
MKTQILSALIIVSFAAALAAFAGEPAAPGPDKSAPTAGAGKVVVLDGPQPARELLIKIDKFEFGAALPLEIAVEGSAKYPDGARITVSVELAETVRGIPVVGETVSVKQGRFASKFKLEPGLTLLSAFYTANAEFDPSRQDPAFLEKLDAASGAALRMSAYDMKLFGTAESRKNQIAKLCSAFGVYVDACAMFYNEINSKFVEFRPAPPAAAPKSPSDNAADESLAPGAAAPSANASDFTGAKETAWRAFLAGLNGKIEKASADLRSATVKQFKVLPNQDSVESADKLSAGLLRRAAVLSVKLYNAYGLDPNPKDLEASRSDAGVFQSTLFKLMKEIRRDWNLTPPTPVPEPPKNK